MVSQIDSSGAERTIRPPFPLPLCPGGTKAGGLPQYLPLGWVDKGGGLPVNLRLMAIKRRRTQGPEMFRKSNPLKIRALQNPVLTLTACLSETVA